MEKESKPMFAFAGLMERNKEAPMKPTEEKMMMKKEKSMPASVGEKTKTLNLKKR